MRSLNLFGKIERTAQKMSHIITLDPVKASFTAGKNLMNAQ
jgi:hypothetical protein